MDKKEALEIVIANGYELKKLPMKFKWKEENEKYSG